MKDKLLTIVIATSAGYAGAQLNQPRVIEADRIVLRGAGSTATVAPEGISIRSTTGNFAASLLVLDSKPQMNLTNLTTRHFVFGAADQVGSSLSVGTWENNVTMLHREQKSEIIKYLNGTITRFGP